MKPEKQFAVLLGCVVLASAIAACWYGVSQHQQSVHCAEGKRVFLMRVADMTRDAHSQLAAGRSKDDVARFFASQGITMETGPLGDHQEAAGTLQFPAPKWCTSTSCTGGGRIRVVVEMDQNGTVLTPGFVFATGANCM